MVGISSTGLNVDLNVGGINTVQPDRQEGRPGPGSPHGDTVEISDEARALLDAKLDEFGVENPQELSDAQKEEIKEAMDAEFGPPPQAGEPGMKGGAPRAEAQGDTAPPAKGDKEAKAAKGGGESEAASDDDDEIEDLEDDIKAIEDEIESLRSKAANDEEAQEELKAKQTELLLLEAELTLLQESETA